ncbi:MAG: protein translocase subunit SecD [Candidatus Omnitrophica bacterium]|nr:protein translocase subunit SecD [Candidatus Omnitrophota bacterium]
MNKSQQWKLVGIIVLTIACVWLIWPPFTVKDKDGVMLQKGKINLGLDLQGGMHVVLKVDMSKLPVEARKDAVERAIEVIRNRVDQFGVGEMAIQRQGRDNIVVQLPGVTDRERALEIIGKTAHLEFKIVSDNVEDLKKAINNEPIDGYELKYLEGERAGSEPLLVAKDASLMGDLLVNAKTEFSSKGFGEPYVSLTFNSKGAQIFANVTATNVGKRLAIVLDNKIVSAPVIREAIPSGQAQISGNFTVDQANDLSVILRAGSLPAPVIVEEERTVGPLLGADSINSGMKASVIGILLVVGFMVLYYRLAGLVANFALVLNVLIILACLSLFKGTLTLPGIAGLILTIGMSVDANVLIYERMREEMALGKSLRAAIAAGYHRALSAIVDSNLTTIVAAALIFKFGTGPIRGFAVTLTIGLLANLFTAVTCTKVIFEVMCDQFGLSKLNFMHIFRKVTNFDFIGKRKIFYIISAILIIAGIAIFAIRGNSNYGVDFSGGTLQQYVFDKPLNLDKVRGILKEIGYGDASIQQYGNPKEIIIRTQQDVSTKLGGIFKKELADNPFQILRVETVGPAVGKNLRYNALMSLALGLAGIMIYVMFRFDLKYGIAGVLALVHDVFVAGGAMSLTHRQFDLTIVAALLTIAGYSINDTVVIYDRIRENLRLVKKGSFAEIVNLSVNQMLGRTILTTGVTMLAVVSLLIFGGSVLSNFSFCIFVGFLTGVYSTVYIASPMVISWHTKLAGVKKR